MYDPPHLIKSSRNNVLKHNFIRIETRASMDGWRIFYTHDKVNQIRGAPKLIDSDIEPVAFTKMMVKLATQLLSETVASCMAI